MEKEEVEEPTKCPKCGRKLLLYGPGWGFCDMCVAEFVAAETADWKAVDGSSS